MKKPLWRRILRLLFNCIVSLVFLIVILYAAGTQFFPDQMSKVIPYQMYTILTDSMVPTIPVGSLVVVRQVDEQAPLTPGTIVTFSAVRFGKPIVLTHYFDSIEDFEGEPRYRTHAEGTDYKDDYVTRRGDIIGVYVTHLPKLGQIPVFLSSSYGITMIAACFFIFLINGAMRRKMEKEKDFAQSGVRFRKLNMEVKEDCCVVTGVLQNRTSENLDRFYLHFSLMKGKECLYEEELSLLEPGGFLEPGKKLSFALRSPLPYPAKSFHLEPMQVGYSIRKRKPINGKPKKGLLARLHGKKAAEPSSALPPSPAQEAKEPTDPVSDTSKEQE